MRLPAILCPSHSQLVQSVPNAPWVNNSNDMTCKPTKFGATSLLAVALMAGLLACGSEPPSAADVMETARSSVVEILGKSGTGTGFIVSEAGLVVTNRHVVEGDDRVLIRVATGEVYLGFVTKTHPTLDLAYIEIDADRNFTHLSVGNSDEIRVGSDVIAIGFPLGSELGRDPTVTTGIISAKRESPDLLQTDALLNPGNSGGPLLDEFGRVIGVNTSRISEENGRAITGISFAIPINEVKKYLDVSALGQLPSASAAAPVPTTRPTATVKPQSQATPHPTATNTSSPATVPTAPPTVLPTVTLIPMETPPPAPTPTLTIPPTATPTPPTATPTPIPIKCAAPEPVPSPKSAIAHEGKEPGELLWHHPESLGLWEGVSGTMVVDGIVYLHGLTAALDAVTGELLWSNPGLSPVLSGDSFYMWTFDGDLQAIDARTGEEIWTYDTPTTSGYAYPLTVAQGVVFTSWDKERVYAVDAGNGELLWRSSLVDGGEITSMAVDSGVVVVGVGLPDPRWTDGYLYGLDVSTGELLWHKEGASRDVFSPSHCSGVVYGTLRDGVYTSYLSAIHPSTGKELYRQEASWSHPIINGERLYSAYSRRGTYSDGTFLIAVNIPTGNRLWKFAIVGPGYAGPDSNLPLPLAVDTDGTLYVLRISENRIHRLEPSLGRELGSYEALAGAISPLSIGVSGSVAYLPTQRGLYAIDLSANELLWRTEFHRDNAWFWPQVANGIVYLTSPQGVYAVKAEPPR